MSFTLELAAALKADLAQLLQLPTEAVYVGRAPQRVTRQGIEVWIRPLEVTPATFERVHAFEVHLRAKKRREADLTGYLQQKELFLLLEPLRLRYHGARPFPQALPALVGTELRETRLDDDPEDPDVLDIALGLKALERAL